MASPASATSSRGGNAHIVWTRISYLNQIFCYFGDDLPFVLSLRRLNTASHECLHHYCAALWRRLIDSACAASDVADHGRRSAPAATQSSATAAVTAATTSRWNSEAAFRISQALTLEHERRGEVKNPGLPLLEILLRHGLAERILDGRFLVAPHRVTVTAEHPGAAGRDAMMSVRSVRSGSERPFFDYIAGHRTLRCGDVIRALGKAVNDSGDAALKQRLRDTLNNVSVGPGGGVLLPPLSFICNNGGGGRTDVIRALLEIGADPNIDAQQIAAAAATPHFSSPLSSPADRKLAPLLALLLDKNGTQDRSVEALLEHGALPDAARHPTHGTAIAICSEVPRLTSLVKLLLRHGADPFQERESGYSRSTLLHLLAQHGCTASLRGMLEHVKGMVAHDEQHPRNSRDDEDTTTSTTTSTSTNSRSIDFFEETTATSGNDGRETVRQRAQRWLLFGAVMTGNSVLHTAASSSPTCGPVCELLLDFERFLWPPTHGVVTQRPLFFARNTNRKMTALAEAIVVKNRETAAVLLKGVTLDDVAACTQPDTSQTLMHDAAAAGSATLVMLLLQHCGDDRAAVARFLDAINRQRETALLIAARGRNEQVCNLLLHAGASADLCFPLHRAARAIGAVPTIRALLDGGASVSLPDDDGKTPLHHAAECGRLPNVELLLQRGADKTKQDRDGLTPLQSAIKTHAPDQELLQLLQ